MNARPDHKSIAALDDAWAAIDALGGSFDPANRYDAGYDAALGDALLVIEEMGGMSPLVRYAAEHPADPAPPTAPADAYAPAEG